MDKQKRSNNTPFILFYVALICSGTLLIAVLQHRTTNSVTKKPTNGAANTLQATTTCIRGQKIGNKCQCSVPWTGKQCEICGLQPHHCLAVNGRLDTKTCTCTCSEEFSCFNGGFIEPKLLPSGANDCRCKCFAPYSGSQCEICSLKKCKNGGYPDANCRCSCPLPYQGAFCEGVRILIVTKYLGGLNKRLSNTKWPKSVEMHAMWIAEHFLQMALLLASSSHRVTILHTAKAWNDRQMKFADKLQRWGIDVRHLPEETTYKIEIEHDDSYWVYQWIKEHQYAYEMIHFHDDLGHFIARGKVQRLLFVDPPSKWIPIIVGHSFVPTFAPMQADMVIPYQINNASTGYPMIIDSRKLPRFEDTEGLLYIDRKQFVLSAPFTNTIKSSLTPKPNQVLKHKEKPTHFAFYGDHMQNYHQFLTILSDSRFRYEWSEYNVTCTFYAPAELQSQVNAVADLYGTVSHDEWYNTQASNIVYVLSRSNLIHHIEKVPTTVSIVLGSSKDPLLYHDLHYHHLPFFALDPQIENYFSNGQHVLVEEVHLLEKLHLLLVGTDRQKHERMKYNLQRANEFWTNWHRQVLESNDKQHVAVDKQATSTHAVVIVSIESIDAVEHTKNHIKDLFGTLFRQEHRNYDVLLVFAGTIHIDIKDQMDLYQKMYNTMKIHILERKILFAAQAWNEGAKYWIQTMYVPNYFVFVSTKLSHRPHIWTKPSLLSTIVNAKLDVGTSLKDVRWKEADLESAAFDVKRDAHHDLIWMRGSVWEELKGFTEHVPCPIEEFVARARILDKHVEMIPESLVLASEEPTEKSPILCAQAQVLQLSQVPSDVRALRHHLLLLQNKKG